MIKNDCKITTNDGRLLPQTWEQMLDAIGFDTYSYATKNDEFKDVVSIVFEDVKPKLKMKKEGSPKYKKYRDCIRHILFNAYFGYAVNLPVKYGRRGASFQASKWYGLNQFKYRIFVRSVDVLIETGYLDGVTGYYLREKVENSTVTGKKEKKTGMRSRYQATDKLKSLFDNILNKNVAERLPRINNIILKDKEKIGIDLTKLVEGKYDVKVSEFKKMTENLRLYNELASKQLILLPLEKVTVTHDLLFKLRLQMSRGMIDIYEFDENNEFGFNFKESIAYMKNIYKDNNNNKYNIHNIHNTDRYDININPIYPLLETFFSKKCNFDIPYKSKGKGSKQLRIKDFLIHIKQNNLHSVFNNSSFKFGGRKYGSIIQELPNRSHKVKITPLRKLLLINFNNVIEIDYKCLHPRLLYNKYLNLPCPSDVYEGFHNRDMVKSSLLVMLNCLDKHPEKLETIEAIRGKLYKEGFSSEDGLKNEDIAKIIKFVEEKHPLIAPWIGSGIAPELMRIDSAIMEDILMNLCHQNIFSIPMHDSAIVEENYQKPLENEMKECYFKHIGQEPVYELK